MQTQLSRLVGGCGSEFLAMARTGAKGGMAPTVPFQVSLNAATVIGLLVGSVNPWLEKKFPEAAFPCVFSDWLFQWIESISSKSKLPWNKFMD